MGFPSLNYFSYDRSISGVCLHPERTVWVVTRCAGQRLHEQSTAAESLRCPRRWCESLRRGCISLQAWLSQVFRRQSDTDLCRTFRIQSQVCRFVCRAFLDFYDSSSKGQDTSSQTHSYGVFLGVRTPHTHCLPF